jgi:hypothetical protein
MREIRNSGLERIQSLQIMTEEGAVVEGERSREITIL